MWRAVPRPAAVQTAGLSAGASGPAQDDTPTPYPLLLTSFSKLFWQTGTTVKIELYRLNPRVFHATLCLVALDAASNEEIGSR